MLDLHYKLRQNDVPVKLLNTLTSYLDNKTQKLILTVIFPLEFLILFLTYINYLSENLASNPKVFADDTSLIPLVENIDVSYIDLNNDLKKTSEWTFLWKMNLNTDPAKQAQELIFSGKVHIINHPSLFFLIKISFRKAPFKSI